MAPEKRMSVEEVAENLYLVPGANKGRFPFSHSILATGERNVLFDTGSGGRELEELKAEFPVDLVVNSHTHPDHFSGNGHFKGFELIVPEMFAGILADLDSMSVRLAGGGEAAEQWLFMVTRFLDHEPTVPTGTFRDGDVIDTGAQPITSSIEEKLRAYEDIVRLRGEAILSCIGREPTTPERIADVSPIYGFQASQQSALFHYFESRMIEKHLERLVLAGTVERYEEGCFRRA